MIRYEIISKFDLALLCNAGVWKMTTVFKAKYPGVCHVCGFDWEPGEYIHYVDDKVAHEHCHSTSGSDFTRDRESVSGTTTFKVRGKREPKLCQSCFQYHNGECP